MTKVLTISESGHASMQSVCKECREASCDDSAISTAMVSVPTPLAIDSLKACVRSISQTISQQVSALLICDKPYIGSRDQSGDRLSVHRMSRKGTSGPKADGGDSVVVEVREALLAPVPEVSSCQQGLCIRPLLQREFTPQCSHGKFEQSSF